MMGLFQSFRIFQLVKIFSIFVFKTFSTMLSLSCFPVLVEFLGFLA